MGELQIKVEWLSNMGRLQDLGGPSSRGHDAASKAAFVAATLARTTVAFGDISSKADDDPTCSDDEDIRAASPVLTLVPPSPAPPRLPRPPLVVAVSDDVEELALVPQPPVPQADGPGPPSTRERRCAHTPHSLCS